MSDFPFGFGLPDPDDPDKKPDPSGEGESESNPATDPLSAMMGAAGMGGADLGAALQRFGQLLSTSSGPVHWELARDTARQVVAANGDASVTPGERAAVNEAVDVAAIWLDDATALPRTSSKAAAWSRAEWIEETLPRWKAVITPLAERMASASAESLPGQVPEEMRAMAGPMLGIISQMSGVMFGGQVGQGLGALAQEVLTSTDVGLRLAPAGTLALLPRNIAAFGEGLGIPDDQVRIFLAVRECAHTRLFDHAPWLTSRIESAVADYARGITIDTSNIERAIGDVDPSNPQAIAELMSSGMFEPPTTPEQQAALDRLEVLLALVEGWVDDVTSAATTGRLPAAAALAETMRRRRATGGPAERTFETLVGLQLRPRRLREASALWRAVAERRDITGRDHLWDHPDLLPDAEALADPEAYLSSSTVDWDISALNDQEPPQVDSDSDDSPST
ncbi:MAG TPA: zinc-dependent metalloprotease [Actinomycetes bacterium]|nr:zinc-dependent metalloprotease [Actinomycetes bacterium]